MKTSSLLFSLAALATPLMAQPNAPSRLQFAGTIAAVEVPCPPLAAAESERNCPALSLLVPETDCFLAVNDLFALAKLAHADQKLIDSGFSGQPLSLAIGTRGSNAKVLTTALQAAAIAEMDRLPRGQARAAGVLSRLREIAPQKLQPVYIVFAGNPADLEKLARLFDAQVERMINDARREFSPDLITREGNSDISVIRLDLTKLPPADKVSAADFMRAVGYKDSLYLIRSIVDGKLLIALANDPADVEVSTRAEDSLLGTDKVALSAECLGAEFGTFLYMSPEVLRETAASLTAVLRHGQSQLRELAKPSVQAPYERLVEIGLNLLAPAVASDKAFTAACWFDGNLHVQMQGDAGGLSAAERPLMSLSSSLEPRTIVYAETTGMKLQSLPSLAEAAEIADALLLAHTRGSELEEYLSLRPCISEGIRALGKLGDGLRGNGAIVVTTEPKLGAAGALRLGVADKKALTEGWQQMLHAVGKGLSVTTDINPDILKVLPFTSGSGAAGTTAYTLQLPMAMPEGLSPQVLVGDAQLVIGSNRELNARMAPNPTSPVSFSGALFRFNPEALLDAMIQSGACDPRAVSDWRRVCRVLGDVTAALRIKDGSIKLRLDACIKR